MEIYVIVMPNGDRLIGEVTAKRFKGDTTLFVKLRNIRKIPQKGFSSRLERWLPYRELDDFWFNLEVVPAYREVSKDSPLYNLYMSDLPKS